MVLSNNSGLYRYNIGDVVRVTRFMKQTPCVEFLHRFGATSSLTGEKLTEVQVVAAVSDVMNARGYALESFMVAPATGGFPHYTVLVELRERVDAQAWATLGAAIDAALMRHNEEYRAKRSSERLGAVTMRTAPRGSFAAYRQQKIDAGVSEGQLKVVHLSRHASTIDAIVRASVVPTEGTAP